MTASVLIHQTFGQISITQSSSRISVRQIPAEMNIEQRPAQLEIHTERGKLSIDQSAPFAEEGLRSSGQLSREAAQLGMQASLAYIGQTSEDGDQLKQDIKSGKAIANMAEKNSRPIIHDFNVGATPQSPVSFSYKSGKVQVDVGVNPPKVQWVPHGVQIEVEKGEAHTTMGRYPSLEIQVVGGQFDKLV